MEATIDWSMGSRAAALVDWGTATQTGRRVGGSGPPTPTVERARMREDLVEVVPYAETLIQEFTGLSASGGFRSRPWLMSRGEWVNANVNGLQRLLEPLAARVLPEGAPRSDLRRKALGAQIGALLGYVSRKVLGQYDAFLPPDDDGLLYFVGRTDDIIKSRGEKVSTVEVENVLHTMAGVRQAAVVGVPDELLGHAIRAYVVLEDGAQLSEHDIRVFAREKLESYMVPGEVVILDELPHTDSGKVRKRTLLEGPVLPTRAE